MKKFGFITIGNQAYFHTIYYSIENINSLYPDVSIYIYDCGFTPAQRQKFREQKNVTLVPWEDRFFDISMHFRSLREKLSLVYNIRRLKDFLPYIKNLLRIVNDQSYALFLKREMRFANKPLCILDCIKRYEENVVFLDGDAVVAQKFDELLRDSFDVGVTLREQGEISINKNSCSVLNSGVLFFLGGRERNTSFLGYWIDFMKKTHERYIEQSALTRLLENVGKDVFTNYNEVLVRLSQGEIRVKILPCRVYNHYRARRYGVTKENKIVHFKSLNYRKEVFYDFLRELGMSIPEAVNAVRKEDL
ncbi:MAG: hypothetical protein HYS87_01635 [Candidatus Colwellbacteria bacterium]|nr:hypothetical protein [Candidatus Colwellbacteria bacterium]